MSELKKIVVVDDDQDIAQMMKAIITVTNPQVDVIIAESAKQALELAIEGVDGVISDYRMPGMSGLEILKELRSKGNHTPIVIMSGVLNKETDTEMIKELEGLSAKPVVYKPDFISEIREIINSILAVPAQG